MERFIDIAKRMIRSMSQIDVNLSKQLMNWQHLNHLSKVLSSCPKLDDRTLFKPFQRSKVQLTERNHQVLNLIRNGTGNPSLGIPDIEVFTKCHIRTDNRDTNIHLVTTQEGQATKAINNRNNSVVIYYNPYQRRMEYGRVLRFIGAREFGTGAIIESFEIDNYPHIYRTILRNTGPMKWI